MAIYNNFKYSGYGINQPLQPIFPPPVVALRAPTSNDIGFPIGQEWIYNNTVYFLTSVLAGAATWITVEASGGTGVFSSLTVTPGPTSITGTTNINTAGAGVTSINTGGTGALNLGNATGNTAVTGSLTASTSLTATLGNITATNGNVVLSTAATYLSLPGPIRVQTGAGAPAAGLAVEIGDMYINTTAASATTRIYVATAAGTWTNVTCAG